MTPDEVVYYLFHDLKTDKVILEADNEVGMVFKVTGLSSEAIKVLATRHCLIPYTEREVTDVVYYKPGAWSI